MTQRDVVLRWIEQIAAVVRRMLFGPGPRDIAAARIHVEEALAQHLGSVALVIPRLDVPSAVALLGDRERILGLALLLDLQASIEAADHHPAEAARLRARALLFREAASAIR